jgi:superfamily II DNA helicase RecQ
MLSVYSQQEAERACAFSFLPCSIVNKFVVVITPTISLINSQLESLRKLDIDAIALGRAAGTNANVNHLRVFL